MTGVRWVSWVLVSAGVVLACGESGHRTPRSRSTDDGGEAGAPNPGQSGRAGGGTTGTAEGGADTAGGSSAVSGAATTGGATSRGGSGTAGGSVTAGGSGDAGENGAGEGGASGEGGTAGEDSGGEGGTGGSLACVAGDTRSCSESGALGRCAGGVESCDEAGGWGECSISPAESDGCSAGSDDDCDGVPNEGCPCTDGTQQACGPATGSGICERGVSTCQDGAFGACEGAIYPRTRNCLSAEDNDCDGQPDDTLDATCQCEAGTTAPCDTHAEDGVGVCRAGTLTCRAEGNGSSTRYGACVGSVGPGPELCFDDGRDEDCDGTVNEAVVCEAVVGADIAAGVAHSCVLLSDGTVRCWGFNGLGELGTSNGTPSPLPVVVSGVSGFNRGYSIDSTQQHNCVVTREARAYCWGNDEYDQLGKRFSSENVIAVGTGYDHTCALQYGGLVRCWGHGSGGLLGHSTPWFDEESWVPVYNVSTATQLSVGLRHSCARMADGSVRCWGQNGSGQVGDDSGLSAVDTGTLVLEVAGATAVAAGGGHTCALLEAGTVKCWGANNSGQLGDGTNSPQPVAGPVLGLSNVTAIEAGHNHTCAIVAGGKVRCWGSNSSGELGDGTTEDRWNPVEVTGLENASALAAGGSHTCALLANGRVRCWGSNYYGQLGDGTNEDAHVPVEVELP